MTESSQKCQRCGTESCPKADDQHWSGDLEGAVIMLADIACSLRALIEIVKFDMMRIKSDLETIRMRGR